MAVESRADKGQSLFALPNYPSWFVADTTLLAASAVHWVALPLVAYELSGSVMWAGWFATARSIVSSITQALGGTYIDRHDHRTLILVQSGVCGLIWLTMGVLFTLNLLTFGAFFALCLSSSAIYGFLGGTTNAALITVVGPSRYAQAESINQGRDAAVNTAGSPLGAALYGLAHATPFFASAAFDFLAFVAGMRMRLPERKLPADQNGGGIRAFVHDLVDGWRWVFKSRTIVDGVIVMALVSFAMFGVMQSVSLHLVSIGTDALLISIVNVASGIATMLGSLISARLVDRIPAGRGIIAIMAFMACSLLPMVLVATYPAILVSLMLVGLPMPLVNALAMGFIFSKTPVDLQGRTRAALMTSIMLFSSGTGAVAGTLLPTIGFQPLVSLFGAVMLVASVAAFVSPRLRGIPRPQEWDNVDL